MYNNTRITLVPRHRKRPSKCKVTFTSTHKQSSEIVKIHPLTDINPPVISTQSIEKSMSNGRNNSNRFAPRFFTTDNIIEGPKKKPFRDPTKRSSSEMKMSRQQTYLIMSLMILITLIVLAALSIDIFLLVRFQSTPTATTKALNAVLRWNASGQTVAGTISASGKAAHQLNLPCNLAIDDAYTLYIADTYNSRIQKWLYGASNGTTIAGYGNGTAGNDSAGLNLPAGIDVDSNGNIYIAEFQSDRVTYWAKGAAIGQRVAGTGSQGNASNQLHSPYDVQFDENAQALYIADLSNNRVMQYPSGILTGTVVAGGNGYGMNPTQLTQPMRIYFDAVSNSLIVVNFGANNIVRWVLGASSWTLLAGSVNGVLGNSSTLLQSPTGVTLDPMGNMYVLDSGNSRIQFFPAGQTIATTIAGITGSPGVDSTQLKSPYAIRLDNQLNIYVADTLNNRIQKFVRY